MIADIPNAQRCWCKHRKPEPISAKIPQDRFNRGYKALSRHHEALNRGTSGGCWCRQPVERGMTLTGKMMGTPIWKVDAALVCASCRLVPCCFFGYPILGLESDHEVRYPKMEVWYELTGRVELRSWCVYAIVLTLAPDPNCPSTQMRGIYPKPQLRFLTCYRMFGPRDPDGNCDLKRRWPPKLGLGSKYPAPPNYPLRYPKYHLIETIRPLIEVLWGV